MPDRDLALKFGQILKRHRKTAKLTQARLAELTGLTPEHIQRLEGKNPSGIRLETIIKLSKALKTPLSRFLKEFDHNGQS